MRIDDFVRARRIRARTVFATPTPAMAREENGQHWELVSGIVALLVAALAMGSTAYSAYLQRKQTHASVWPRIVLWSSNTPDYRVVMENKGIGPAIVQYVAIRVDGRAAAGWNDVIRLVLGSDQKRPHTTSAMNRAILMSREGIDVLRVHDEALGNALGAAGDRLHFTVCYCSIFEDCWTMTDPPGEARPVAACPQPGPEAFTE